MEGSSEGTINQAIDFATRKFEEVSLKNHFLDVYKTLKDDFKVIDQDVLIAGILHDTLEDTDTTKEEIEQKFSGRVASIVDEVSHPKNYNSEQKKEYYEKIKHISEEGKMIKLADFTSHLKNFVGAFTGENNLSKFIHNEYCVFIRNFLESCKDSEAKAYVSELNDRLDNLIASS